MLIKTFVVQPYYIPSESMENTLYGCSGCSGDRILVNKPIYDLRDPHPGDIVVFKAPQHWDNEPVPTATVQPAGTGGALGRTTRRSGPARRERPGETGHRDGRSDRALL